MQHPHLENCFLSNSVHAFAVSVGIGVRYLRASIIFAYNFRLIDVLTAIVYLCQKITNNSRIYIFSGVCTTSVFGHTMEAMEGALPDVSQQAEKECRKQKFERCITSLVHASQCRVVDCGELQCQKLKRIIGHAKECKRKSNGGCKICKQFIALCCYHAKQCQQVRCPLLYCSAIKEKLQQRFAYVKHVRLCCNHLLMVY